MLLSNIEITNKFNNEPRFNGVFSRSNLPKVKDGASAINLNDKKKLKEHIALLFIDRNTAVCFDSFEIEYIPLEVLKTIRDKSITHNMFKIQDDESII